MAYSLPRKAWRATVDKVGGILEVRLTDGNRRIVIRHPDLKPDAKGATRIVLSPRHARHLANLLVEHAEYCEAEAERISRMLTSSGAEFFPRVRDAVPAAGHRSIR